MAPSFNDSNRTAMKNNKLDRLLRVTHSASDATEALKFVIPAIASGININTHLGNLALHGEDAEAVFALVTEIALRRSGQGGQEGVNKSAASVNLANSEQELLGAITRHVYPDPTYGTTLPIEPGELRTAKALHRKGLVIVSPSNGLDGGMQMTFTPLGAAVYERESARQQTDARKQA